MVLNDSDFNMTELGALPGEWEEKPFVDIATLQCIVPKNTSVLSLISSFNSFTVEYNFSRSFLVLLI